MVITILISKNAQSKDNTVTGRYWKWSLFQSVNKYEKNQWLLGGEFSYLFNTQFPVCCIGVLS